MRQTRDQRCASAAAAFLAPHKTAQMESIDAIATASKKTATRVLTCGLGAAVAFCRTKKAKESDEKFQFSVAEALAEHLLQGQPKGTSGEDAAARLQSRMIADGSEMLRRHTEEALVFLQWVARLAEGMHANYKASQPRNALREEVAQQ